MRPSREPASNNQQTYFVSFQTAERTPLFRHERWLSLLLRVLTRYQDNFRLHDYVVMEDHVHLLLTPTGALERSLQLIKGGFSFQAKREFVWNDEIWQKGFTDHRVRDIRDYERYVRYIRKNLDSLSATMQVEPGRHSSTCSVALHSIPQRLKPMILDLTHGAAQAAPLQSTKAAEKFVPQRYFE